ncbi:MAG: heavy-metal-associated domain-containing protein [Pyrinomonadaceae bacterium]
MKKRHVVGLLILAVITTFSTAAVSARSSTVTIRIEGMHCKNCAASVQKKLKATEGVEDVRVSFEAKQAWVKFDDQKISVAKIRGVINSTGFKAVEDQPNSE